MKQEKQQAIALMRYGAIAPLIAGLDEDYPSKTAFYMELSTKGLVGPDGRVHHYAPSTIEKWYLDYQNHGFDALIPKGRSDAGMSRKLDDELQERIRYFKTNYPRMSAAAIYRQLKMMVSHQTDRFPNPQSAASSTSSRSNCGRLQTGICAVMNARISMRCGAATAVSDHTLLMQMAKNTVFTSCPD